MAHIEQCFRELLSAGVTVGAWCTLLDPPQLVDRNSAVPTVEDDYIRVLPHGSASCGKLWLGAGCDHSVGCTGRDVKTHLACVKAFSTKATQLQVLREFPAIVHALSSKAVVGFKSGQKV